MLEWVPQRTDDGSFTFFSETFGEAFHSMRGARAEAFEKFARATHLRERATGDRLCILDVCYGLGYNTAAALETIWAVNPYCHVTVYGLELDVTVPRAAVQPPLIESWSLALRPILVELAESCCCDRPNLTARLLIGDARQTIQTLPYQGVQADAILFDPFSPRRCPQLWTVEFFAAIARCLATEGVLATYSRAASVRRALQLAGLHIGSIPLNPDAALPHEWSQGTVARHDGSEPLPSLSPMEQEHLHTRAAVPYRDPSLQGLPETIQARHQQEQVASKLESTSSWRRRWKIH
ncbi:tRNA (5-methylaminomethyl-2-thiouridine)(34)-methyltransferase MnmD [Vacuolonema iberomarrocanum]|uniref:tRNA (5-methylaminomethyl-2-thiouridine)(34)-methyltransferase MnmD n=1 Tax=Vacuolonema iberomarrocanum TaxID=3454632 RepID=UPI003F6DC00D